MRKIFLIICLLLSASWMAAQEESLLLVNPGRETFVHFPSQTLGNDYVVTFFLPEPRVPLTKNYPVVVLLGVSNQQAQDVAALQKKMPAIVVGINFSEEDYTQRAEQIVQFLSRELLPYVDTNYWTIPGTENHWLAASGKYASEIALRVVQNPNLYGGLFLASTRDVWQANLLPPVRTFIIGAEAELAAAQQFLEESGKVYGVDFALRYLKDTAPWFVQMDTSYLRAPAQEVVLKRVDTELADKTIRLSGNNTTRLRSWAILANDSFFDYIPLELRMSPPYLSWNPFTGALKVIPGAVPGKVVIGAVDEKPAFTVKLKIKKAKK